MDKPVILVTGKDGQLGSELTELSQTLAGFQWIFFTRELLDITDPASCEEAFRRYKPKYLINAAAYTAVDRAETERSLAHAVNAVAPGHLASVCSHHKATIIHLSTDYVYNGRSEFPYRETDDTDPVNYYGFTKLEGEKRVRENCPESVVIRTSWVYSTYGKNFVKTMLRLMAEKPSIQVVDDQFGAPTYAADLARSVVQVIQRLESGEGGYGVFHYSNEGRISWFDFACEIKRFIHSPCEVKAIPSSAYPTPAKRPFFSLMDTEKIKRVFNLTIPGWQESLHSCLKKLVNASDVSGRTIHGPSGGNDPVT